MSKSASAGRVRPGAGFRASVGVGAVALVAAACASPGHPLAAGMGM